MSLTAILALAAPLLATVLPNGLVAFVAVGLAKNVKAIPLNEGQTARLRLTAAVLTSLGAIASSLADGVAPTADAERLATTVLTAAASWAFAHLLHKANKNVVQPLADLVFGKS